MAYGYRADPNEAPPDELAPVLEWDDFTRYVFRWDQGQHVGLIGPTDSGKSVLTKAILPMRSYVTFFATKPRDKELAALAESGGWLRFPSWPPTKRRAVFFKRELSAEEAPRRILWPDATTLGAVKQQRREFHKAISAIYAEGGWTVVWDEFWMMCSILGLEQHARILLQQARSNDISFVMGAQRPSRIPLELFDQSRHLFFFRDNDERNLTRISGVGWLSAGPIRSFVAALEPHQVLYVNTRTGDMYRTRAPYSG